MIVTEEKDDRVILKPDFDLVAGRVSEVREAILQAAKPGRRIVLALTDTIMMDSWGIGVVVGCQKTLQEMGANLSVETTNQNVIDLFELLNLDFILDADYETVKNSV